MSDVISNKFSCHQNLINYVPSLCKFNFKFHIAARLKFLRKPLATLLYVLKFGTKCVS